MKSRKPTSRSRISLCLPIVGGLALAVSFAFAAVLATSDVLTGDVATVLARGEESRPEGMLTICLCPPTGVARGIQLGLLMLLLGGLPAAIVACVLVRPGSQHERRWSEAWGNVFLGGLVFQLSSVAFTAFVLFLLGWAAMESAVHAEEALSYGIVLVMSVACGIPGLRAWRVLQFEVDEPLTSISAYLRAR
jgi:hypothetical protein